MCVVGFGCTWGVNVCIVWWGMGVCGRVNVCVCGGLCVYVVGFGCTW